MRDDSRQFDRILVLLVLFCLFIFSRAKCQEKWYIPSKNDWMGYGAMAIAGISKAYNQAILHHHYGRGKQYWDQDISWKNKYKDWDGGDYREAFLGSKTIFVPFTDGQHLTYTGNTLFTTIGTVAISLNLKEELKNIPKKDKWKFIAFRKIAIPFGIRAIVFETLFNILK